MRQMGGRSFTSSNKQIKKKVANFQCLKGKKLIDYLKSVSSKREKLGHCQLKPELDKFINIMGSKFKNGALFETQDIVTNTVTCESDVNLKKNIETMEDGRGLVSKLRPVTYNWKTDTVMDKIEYGFIAQEVEPERGRVAAAALVGACCLEKLVNIS